MVQVGTCKDMSLLLSDLMAPSKLHNKVIPGTS